MKCLNILNNLLIHIYSFHLTLWALRRTQPCFPLINSHVACPVCTQHGAHISLCPQKWKPVWLSLTPPSSSGVGRLEIQDMGGKQLHSLCE